MQMERLTAHLLSEIDSTSESSDEQDVRHGQAGLPDGTVPAGLLDSDVSQTPSPGSTPILTVRSARASDAFGLRRVRSVVRLNQPEAMLDQFHPIRGSLSSSLPLPRSRSRLFVAHHGTRIQGFVHVEPVWPDQRWVITEVGGAGSEPIETRTAEALFAHAVVAAGSNGVKRVFGRVDGRSQVADAFRAVGFGAYASETVFLAQGLTAPTNAPRLRAQEQTDTWAIHQLYNASVPRQVQYAEAYTSHRWDVARRPGRMPKNGKMTGWLIEEGHHVVGYVRVASREGTHVVELVYHPDRREVIGDLVDGALTHVVQHQPKRVYCALRSYQAEAEDALITRGFRPILDQALFLKYTTANVRVPNADSVPVHLEVREKLPQRVPTFLHGTTPDESAT
jgi:hypothetical protein